MAERPVHRAPSGRQGDPAENPVAGIGNGRASHKEPVSVALSEDEFREELRRVETQVTTAIGEVLKQYSTHQKVGLVLDELIRLTTNALMAERKDWDRSEPFANWVTQAATKFAKKAVLAKLLEENRHAAAQAVAKYFSPNRKGRGQDDD